MRRPLVLKKMYPQGDILCLSMCYREDDQRGGQAEDLTHESAERVQKHQQEQASGFGGLTGSSRVTLGVNLG